MRCVLWASVAACAGMLWWAWGLAHTFGLNPGDGGVLRPLGERLAWAAATGGLGLAFAAAMIVYARHYVVAATRDGDTVTIDTMTFLGTRHRVHALEDFGRTEHHEGRFVGRSIVNAPWLTLPVRGRRFGYIIDLQAEMVDGNAIATIGQGKSNKKSRATRRAGARASRRAKS